ncbi:MAG TPA: DUF3489 domain-containing protein [Pseudohaliea sp.]|nr:DUF3489 domain-containing protein [Pseudohaliea sp.]
MAKLTPTQNTLLRLGAHAPDGTIDLSPIKDKPPAALSAALGALKRKGLAEKAADGSSWRITGPGREAADLAGSDSAAALSANAGTSAGGEPAGSKKGTRRAQFLGLLQRQDGASMAEMQAATGWQAHSIRALLSGLRKDGMTILSEKKPGEASRYRVLDEQAAR